ncbi:putative tRNA pseudouridine synthase Pus10 isoform X2 [Camellia sinensis]|uniref:putative tRNA pseudouridine synthase Pus10 isoform X2 n=1 Tax=Camellia sinensis TaxID=4442 RepID=UPI00103552DF|nr:putative tRNA pseudouridine synthase Pus10 isoform X2 [Camellia sinensis]
MENETKAAAVSSAAGDEAKLLSDTVPTLPPLAVKDLLSIGVCIRCIFRFFGVSECIYSYTSLSTSVLHAAVGKMGLEGDMVNNGLGAEEDLNTQHSFEESELEPNFCRICLGILQFAYHDNKEMLVKRNRANDFALLIAEVVKQEGHQIDNFSLEVSIPSRVMEQEQAVWLYMKRKYSSELWFQEKFLSERISAKDVLKLSITNPLETLLDVKSSVSSSFRIRLTYTHSEVSTKVQNFTEKKECNKRRKIGDNAMETIDGCVVAATGHSDLATSEEYVSKRSCNGLQNYDSPDLYQFQLEKYSRNVSQTRWIIDDERMGEASVEEIIGSNILPMCQGDNYKFHAAGREDIDVRMLGSGRPFLVEIQNAHRVPSEMSLKEIEGKINRLENKLVKVKNVKVVGSQGWSLMREGEAEKQKQYAALVWISRSIEDDDLKTLSAFKDMPILQRTPIRVLHRRSPLEREKIIHWMKIERIAGSSQYFLLHLCTQAGTYIKEFVHGDLGRTHPSVGSILGCRAEILQLDVTDVKMDCFLTE